jgi:hypothetical protein
MSLYRIHHNISAAELRKEISEETWRFLSKITIVRNPYDRAISKFYNDHKDFLEDNQKRGYEYSADQINEYIVGLPDADLTNWHLYTDDDQIIVDDVIRYESLTSDLGRALAKVGITDPIALPHAKGNWRIDRRHYSQVLGSQARARIEAAAARELEMFGYCWKDTQS